MGYFITLEGIDGAGKSSALAHIKKYIEGLGRTIELTREPGGSPLAERIRELLLLTQKSKPPTVMAGQQDEMPAITELLLIYAARADHIDKAIKPALAADKIVVCDRFSDASFAYQCAGRGLPQEWFETLQSWVLDALRPNLTLLFDLPVNTAMARRYQEKDAIHRFEKENHDFFERVRAGYLALAKQEPKRIRVIDASVKQEDVFSQIDAMLKEIDFKW